MRGAMSDFYVKHLCSDKSQWLQEHYTNAYLLLMYIARNSRKTNSIPDGLEIGDCILGELESPKKCGLSLKEYRNAFDKLIEFGFIELVYHPQPVKTVKGIKIIFHQKRAIKRAIKSKVVNLCNYEVCDIRFGDKVDQKVDQWLTKGRPEVDKQNKKNKSDPEREQQPQTPKGACVVFSCLEKINDPSIGQKEKERLTRKNEGNEQVVIDAVDSVLQSSFTPETTFLRSLNAAIKGQWKPLPEKEDSIKLNKKKALELQMKGHPFYKIEACNTYLEIIAGPISHIVQYDLQSDKFGKQVMEHLKIGKQA